MLYTVRSPIMTRRAERSDRYRDNAEPEVRSAAVKHRIVTGLLKQAKFFGADLPPDDDIDLIEAGKFRVKKVHDRWAFGIEYAVISMPAQMVGIWQTGQLLSHGQGVIVPLRRQQAEKDAA
jgi:hypothetical protein